MSVLYILYKFRITPCGWYGSPSISSPLSEAWEAEVSFQMVSPNESYWKSGDDWFGDDWFGDDWLDDCDSDRHYNIPYIP